MFEHMIKLKNDTLKILFGSIPLLKKLAVIINKNTLGIFKFIFKKTIVGKVHSI